jgi:hypothetical protein
MSEYQYYEFRAIDRPLTEEEQQAVARLSSRVDPHPWRAVFTYSWSDFPGQPGEVLARYYDAMLYMANWGSRRLMFRFPRALVNLDQMEQYRVETVDYASDALAVYTVGEYVVLDIQAEEEEGGGWIAGEGWLDALLGLRDAILQGDYRLLYLAWLRGLTAEYEVDEEALEPPPPPGLGKLTPALRDFIELFAVDDDLVQVAAEASGKVETVSEDDLRRAIAALAPGEKDAFLLRLAQGEPLLSLALKQRLKVSHGLPRGAAASRRTGGELLAAATALQERKRREQASKAEARRIAELEALARREKEVWQEVDALIQESKSKSYDRAVPLLLKLKDLAAYQRREMAFQDRLDRLWKLYRRRHGLLRRLRQANLTSRERG